MKILSLIFFIVAINISFAVSFAADTDDDSGSDLDSSLNVQAEMKKIRKLIASARYKYAITLLHDVVRQEYRNADAWNLIGYSHRKLGKFKKAGSAYRKALEFNPDHKGALEYQGQLFIELNEIDRARSNFSKLKMLCPDGCEQLSELEAALKGKSRY